MAFRVSQVHRPQTTPSVCLRVRSDLALSGMRSNSIVYILAIESVKPDISTRGVGTIRDIMQTRDEVEGLRNYQEFSQPLFLNRLAKGKQLLGETKRFVFLRAAPVRKQWNPFENQLSRAGE